MKKEFPYVVGHVTGMGDQIRFTTEEAASKFIGEVLMLVDPDGVLGGSYYIDDMNMRN